MLRQRGSSTAPRVDRRRRWWPRLTASRPSSAIRPGPACAPRAPSRWSGSWSRPRTEASCRAAAEDVRASVIAEVGRRERARLSLSVMCGIVGVRRRPRRARDPPRRASSGSSTAVTTRPGSRSSTPGRCGAARAAERQALGRGAASSATTRRRDGRRPGSATPAGRPTARRRSQRPPHVDCTGGIAVVHNGIIENHRELRRALEAAATRFTSDTDTEVVAHLVEERSPRASTSSMRCGGAARARRARSRSRSSAADARTWSSRARRNSPLVVGLGDGETLPRRAMSRRSSHTPVTLVEIGEDQIVELPPTGRWSPTSTAAVEPRAFHVDWDVGPRRRAATPTSCSRRSASSREAVADTLLGRFRCRRADRARRAAADRRRSCGSRPGRHRRLRDGVPRRRSSAKYAIEPWARLPSRSISRASSATATRSSTRETLVIASASRGETLDTLEAVQRRARAGCARSSRSATSSGSSIPRESDAVIYTHAGPEVGVASTKTFLAQIAAL